MVIHVEAERILSVIFNIVCLLPENLKIWMFLFLKWSNDNKMTRLENEE